MAKKVNHDVITEEQKNFYYFHSKDLINKYLNNFPRHVDPDAIRDLFIPIGYNRSNVQEFQGICKVLTQDIFEEALKTE